MYAVRQHLPSYFTVIAVEMAVLATVPEIETRWRPSRSIGHVLLMYHLAQSWFLFLSTCGQFMGSGLNGDVCVF